LKGWLEIIENKPKIEDASEIKKKTVSFDAKLITNRRQSN
jgi:hypothetical protein